MSYCRFSPESDVYVYASTLGGWETMVAHRRGDLPDDWDADLETSDQFFAAIGLPHDGKTFTSPTAKKCAALLVRLRADGYRVPSYALERLATETRANRCKWRRREDVCRWGTPAQRRFQRWLGRHAADAAPEPDEDTAPCPEAIP
jgi:hypothetical protein